jgi:hypothetical protein
VTEDIVEKFKIKCQPIKDFTQVWNSQDTQSQSQVALWYPSLSVSMMSSTKVRTLGVLTGGNDICYLGLLCFVSYVLLWVRSMWLVVDHARVVCECAVCVSLSSKILCISRCLWAVGRVR